MFSKQGLCREQPTAGLTGTLRPLRHSCTADICAVHMSWWRWRACHRGGASQIKAGGRTQEECRTTHVGRSGRWRRAGGGAHAFPGVSFCLVSVFSLPFLLFCFFLPFLGVAVKDVKPPTRQSNNAVRLHVRDKANCGYAAYRSHCWSSPH